MSVQLLQHMKRMLDLRAYAGLGLLELRFHLIREVFFMARRTLRFIAMRQVTALSVFSGHLSAP